MVDTTSPNSPRSWLRRLAVALRTTVVTGSALAMMWVLVGAGGDDGLPSRRLAPGGPLAFETRYATVITDSAKKARWVDEQLGDAVAGFVGAFGVDPGRGVIVELPYVAYLETVPEAQRRWSLPWMTQYFGLGNRTGALANGHHFDNESGIRHELNHVFFTAAFFPDSHEPQYGSDAPDWLDEAVALVAERPEAKARRRAHFHAQVCSGRLMPLDRFLEQPHPLFALPSFRDMIAARKAANAGAPGMMAVRVDQLQLPKDALLDFYAQSLAVADFLMQSTGDPKILAHIVRDLKGDGASRRPTWIARTGASDAAALAGRFEAWSLRVARAGTADCRAAASLT